MSIMQMLKDVAKDTSSSSTGSTTKTTGGTTTSGGSTSSTTTTTTANSKTKEEEKKKKRKSFLEVLKEIEEEEAAKKAKTVSPIGVSFQDAFPWKAPTVSQSPKKSESTKQAEEGVANNTGWFRKGLLEDGYDFGDVTKTILGTAVDALEDLGAGIAEMPEKIIDAGATLAPYYQKGQLYQQAYSGGNLDAPVVKIDQELQKMAHDFDMEQAKKETDEFIKRDLYDGKAIAHSLLNPVTDAASAIIGQEYENASVLGDKADATVQSGGQMLATMGLQAVGVPWFLTTGVTSYGAEMENALNQGATHEEAMGSAAISAAAEVLTEKISGGIKFGGKALDDALTQQISRGISNKLGRTVARLGVDFAGEAGEELLSEIAGNLGSALYRLDEESWKEILLSEEAMQGYLDAMIGGGMMGGVSGGFKAIDSTRKGVDYVSGLTKNEQAVVDKVYKDRLAEEQKKGKVTEKQKSEIYDRVLSDMDNGYISIDTIEEALGGETLERYKKAAEWEKSLQDEYDTLDSEYKDLLKMKRGDQTGEQQLREAELKELLPQLQKRNENAFATSTLGQIKTQLGQEVADLVKGDRLVESYNEQVRRKQAFTADLSKYDAKQRQHIQDAIDSGVLHNGNRAHEIVDFTAKVSADTGMSIKYSNTEKIRADGLQPKHTINLNADGNTTEFDLGIKNLDADFKPVVNFGSSEAVNYKIDYKNGKIVFESAPAGDVSVKVQGTEVVDAVYTKDGIILNVKSPKYLEMLTGHEVTHGFEKAKNYGNLAKAVKAFAEAKGEWESRLADKQARYEGIENADPEREVIADLIGEYIFKGGDFIMELSVNHRNVFQKMFDEIKYLCKVATAGSKEARRLEAVKHEFEKIYREGAEKTTAESGAKYHLNKNAKTELHKALYDKKYQNEVLLRDVTPAIMLAQKGVKNLPMAMNASHIRENVFTEAEAKNLGLPVNSSTHYHGLGEDFFLKVIDGLDNVKEAYRGTKNASNPARGENYFLLVSEFTDDSGNIVNVPVYINEHAQFNRVFVDVNKISTVYGKKNFRDYISKQVRNKDLVRVKNRSTQSSEPNAPIAKGYRLGASGDSVAQNGDSVKYSLVEDQKTIDFLENQDHITTYKAMVLIDGKLYPPMASQSREEVEYTDKQGNKKTKTVRKLKNPSVLGKWQQADERPDLAAKSFNAKRGYSSFDLLKSNGKTVPAAYNPYEHTSNIVLNDQFEEAYNRPELVTVEYHIPVSELTSGYKADYAKDAVGQHSWKSGPVAKDLKDPRQVYLTRWSKPVRIVPDSEVAAKYKEILSGTGLSVPFNVVTPSLLSELEKAGVAIDYEGSPMYKSIQRRAKAKEVKYSLSDSDGKQLTKEQQEYFKESKVRDENGSLMVMYHGTPNGSFTVFKDGTYFTDSKEYADIYQNPGASSISTGKEAKNPKTFEVYLDIKKPFDINDAEARDIYINDYIKGGNAMGINPYLSDAEYAKINSIDWTEGEDLRDFLIENGYDYDGLVLDEGGTGGYGDEVQSRGKSYVVFKPEQVKNVDNLKPSGDPDIRFSLSESVEETKDLMAIHNLTGEKLLKSLRMGGLPMPSVAIAKAKDGHGEFGEISLILPRDSIDPESSSRNKLYSGDAWTPTYPKVDYKPSGKVLKDVRGKINALVPDEVQNALGYLGLDEDNARDNLDRYNGNMVEAYKRNEAMMYAFLKDTGSDISLPMKEAPLYRYGDASNESVRYFAGKLVNGLQTIELYQNMSARDMLQDKALTEAVADAQNFDVLRTLEPGSKEYLEYERNPVFRADEVNFRDIDGYLSASRKLLQNGVQQTVDKKAARDLIRDAVDQTAYEGWLGELFSGVVEKEGIRNNKDVFTPSGNRRSFEALHYEHNLENVIKAMQEKGEKGIAFGGGSIFGAATTEFSSVEEMKQASGRLQQMSEEEYQEIKEGFTNRFFELASSLPKNKSNFIATDDAANTLVEAVAKYNTKRGIANYLKRELDGWANYSPQVVDDLLELVKDIRSMPTGYFEAKPQRAVGFEEVGVFVIPYDADVKLKQELLNRGYSIAEYDPKVEGDRQRVVNQFEEYKFSLSNVGDEPVSSYRATLGRDIALQDTAPVGDDIAPTAEESSTVAKNAPVAPEVTAAEMRELFPDEGDNPQVELDNLTTQQEALENRMLQMGEDGDWSSLEAVNDEWMAVQARRAVLEAELAEGEADRIGSLEDADAPPEMDAPVAMKSDNYNPYGGIGLHEITRSTRSISDQNPGARRFIEEAALGLLYDVNNSTKGERWYNDQLYYDSGGEQGFGGTSRQTTADIADLKDTYGYTWDQLRKAAENVAAGDFRSVAAKRIEYLLNTRLMEGFTDVDGRRYEPNQEYISFMNETFANQQAQEQFDSFMETADEYSPEEIAPVLKKATPDTLDAPIFESNDPGTIKGQTTMFEPKKPPVGKTAKVLTEDPKVNKKTSKIWSMIQEHFLDNGMVFENVSKKTGNRELEAKWNFIRYSRAKAQSLIGKGTNGVKSLKDIKKEVDKSGKTEAFYDYLYHRHNEDRMSLEDRFGVPNKAVYGDHVTAGVSRAMYTQYEKKNPEFKRWANDIYAYNKHLRNLLVENDVISKETAALWEKMYPHYVPVGRVDQDGLNINVPLDSRKTGVNNPVKRATGGNQDLRPLFNVMAERTEQTYRAISRNSFGIELKNTLGSVVEHNAQNLDEVIESIGSEEALLKPGMNGQNPTFSVFEKGERVEFEITEEMYNALKPKSEAMAYRNKILNTASNVFRGLTTQYSIPFMATNAIKDAQDVLINSQHPLRTYANFPRAWVQQLTKGKWYQEYIENGGEDNTYFDNETSAFKEDNWFMKGLKLPLNAISAANNFIELTPRLSEYIASREAGRSIEVSMLDAARVTTNFAAGGDVTKFLNANGATFLNASVQGAVQKVRNIREAHQNGLAGYVGLAARFVAAGLPAILLNNMLWDDDEEYEELADYVKRDYYVVGKYDDGKFIRIPKGRTVAVIQNAIEQVQNAATGDDEVDLGAFFQLAISNLAPNNPVENNIFAPIMQVAKNETWYGEDLVPSRLQDLPAAEQYDEEIDTLSRKLGEALNVSPYKINYLLNQYSGGIGDVVLPMMTPKAEHGDDSFWGNVTAPLKDKFTTDSILNNKNPGDFYDLQDELEVTANGKNATAEDKMKAVYMDAVSLDMGDLYAKKREIQNSDLPDSEKYEKVRELQNQINALARNALGKYNNVSTDGNYSEAGDRRFNYDADKDKWYEITPENADGEDNWYYVQEQLSHDKLGMSYADFWNGKKPSGGTYYGEYNGKRYNYDADDNRWYEIREKNEDGSDNWYYQKEQEVTKSLGISYEEYWNKREEYNFAYDKPGKYAISQAVGGYDTYMEYYDALENWQSDNYIAADKDSQGNSISGSRKKKVMEYIDGLDLDAGEKIILYRSVYSSKKDKNAYNMDIVNYLNSRNDLSYARKKAILEELDFTVDSEGYIDW